MDNQTSSAMAREIRQTPQIIAGFLTNEKANLTKIGADLRRINPAVVVTCARGSSDNAAAYFKYLTEILLGVPVASVGPSVASIYNAPLKLKNAVVVSVSQSGKSPDIVALQSAAKAAGAYAIAVVNDANSPLAQGANAVVPLHAGIEDSVAATKTFLASAVALAALVASWSADAALSNALENLPQAIATAITANWQEAVPLLTSSSSAYIIGRGPAFPIAVEAALKLKETAMLHAEPFSGAEVMHGPLQLVKPGFPVLAFRPQDAAFAEMGSAIQRIKNAGGTVLVAEQGAPQPGRLAFVPCAHTLLDPVVMLTSFYDLAERVAQARGYDPDRPSNLRKVTETL